MHKIVLLFIVIYFIQYIKSGRDSFRPDFTGADLPPKEHILQYPQGSNLKCGINHSVLLYSTACSFEVYQALN